MPSYNYDLEYDVLYIGISDRQNSYGDEQPNGDIILRDATTESITGLTVLDFLKGHLGLDHSVEIAKLNDNLQKIRFEICSQEREKVGKTFPCDKCDLWEKCRAKSNRLYSDSPPFICTCRVYTDWRSLKDYYGAQIDLLNKIQNMIAGYNRYGAGGGSSSVLKIEQRPYTE